MANIAHSTLPEYSGGIINKDAWVNYFLGILSYVSVPGDVEKIIYSSPFTPVPGKIYLIGAGSTSATPGTLAIFSTNLTSSIQGFAPTPLSVIKSWTCFGGDWVREVFSDGGLVIFNNTVPVTVNLSNDFNGICDFVVAGSDVLINPAASRSSLGLVGINITTLGHYKIFQDTTISII